MGTFVVSLDFELHWGVRDHRTVAEYRENLLGVRRVIPALLAVFSEYRIRATWATVGFLFFESKDELMEALPKERPIYTDRTLDPYVALNEIGENESADPFHFAPTLIHMIKAAPEQEIATHTLSHFYAMAAGPSLESFRADIRAALSAGRRLGVEIKSIVFPRNQVTAGYVRVCAEEGLIAYRGIEVDPLIAAGRGAVARAKRLADSYVNVAGPCCGVPKEMDAMGIVSVPQSRFLRPYDPRLAVLDGLRLRRILSSMTFAAQNQRLFHLWWHPHNFGKHTEQNIGFLRGILDHFKKLEEKFDFHSASMVETAERVLATSGTRCQVS